MAVDCVLWATEKLAAGAKWSKLSKTCTFRLLTGGTSGRMLSPASEKLSGNKLFSLEPSECEKELSL